jgi:hypothetical protein
VVAGELARLREKQAASQQPELQAGVMESAADPFPTVTGMFIWPQIDDQRQRSLVMAGAHTTSTSEAV